MELLQESSGSYDQLIIKGKRTKRPRQPSYSSEISMNTEEDEDMANCLILLARGGGSPACSNEMEGKIGMYVYECKTCNRTFPSFQALGGHRASHKRLKLGTDESDRKKSPMMEFPIVKHTVLLTQLPVVESKSKVHECATCGAEFGSGQALGGHMRRHRSIAPPASYNNNIVITGTSIDNDISQHDVSEKSRNVFGLDLNLPAEPEDNQWQERFHFSSFSAAAAAPLVGCHY